MNFETLDKNWSSLKKLRPMSQFFLQLKLQFLNARPFRNSKIQKTKYFILLS